MPPQRAITRPSRLQFRRRETRLFQPCGIGFAGGRRRRINLFEILHRHRRLLRDRGRCSPRRNRSGAMPRWPISEMSWPICRPQSPRCTSLVDVPAIGAKQLLQTVADDGRTQMAHMHGLGDIRSAEIDDELFAFARLRRAEPRIVRHRADAFGKRAIGHVEIDEARPRDLDFRRTADRLSDAPRSFLRWRADWLSRPWHYFCTSGVGSPDASFSYWP